MEETRPVEAAVLAKDLAKSFPLGKLGRVQALGGVSLAIARGTLTALVGPDGAGKTTFLRLVTGLLAPEDGTLEVLGLPMPAGAAEIQRRIGYMPQKFGLYEDLSVQENLDLYADLHGVTGEMRKARYEKLLHMTALAPFTGRLAGRLSGGMKQKLGLACTLVRSPELLVLDEPTVGVDPLSRRELWEIVTDLVRDEGLTVLVSTSYLDEAEKCGSVVILREGRIVASGAPETIRALATGRSFVMAPPPGKAARSLQSVLLDRADLCDAVPEGGLVRCVASSKEAALSLEKSGAKPVPPRLEDGFMGVLHAGTVRAAPQGLRMEKPFDTFSRGEVIAVRGLVRRFGDFTAVDHVDFSVRRGEVFGLLGPNGAGKTTTFRMLCGLLPASGGHLEVAGMNLRNARADARKKLGYVAQKFSLYGDLTVMENLTFFARAYGLNGTRRQGRIDWALASFELSPWAGTAAGQLPGGFRQRLAMAAALLHEPEILFLDEPTSGADPLARREFWKRITALSEEGVTIVVTTHFMEEAEYCDHIVIQDAGKILARGTPAEVRALAHQEKGRAAARGAKSSLYPSLSGNAAYEHQRLSGNRPMPIPVPVAVTPMDTDTHSLSLDAAYELDLFGRIRSQSASAKAQMQATAADLETMHLSIAAEVAETYFALRAKDEEIAQLSRTVQLREEEARILAGRFEKGLIAEIDATRARSELAGAKAALALAQGQKADLYGALALLCGKAPANLEVAPATAPLPENPPLVPADLPSALLERRSDIASAEKRLAAKYEEIGVARAAYFPSISLVGSGGTLSSEASDLFDAQSAVWSVAPRVSLPLFTAGRTKANVERAKAAYDEALANYKQSVLTAFREVDSALAASAALARQDGAAREALSFAKKTADLAKARYEAGYVDYMTLADAERRVLEQERALSQLSAQRYAASVRLVKALGGGWSEK
jgi:ABC-2 type transport system ATP-binding protein